ncbi:hypothetical protein DLJ58_10265 [Micromonospora arida]|uniref:Uncharacterized protein n=1 Tax=Micromonospora arida TaxID=2203715 RepID=A0A3N9XDE7_9ACTN|nr:hypothetical protein DLJ58_10265 [Micromonospora arida]
MAMVLWLGELRVQRLLSRRPSVAIAQLVPIALILVFLGLRVNHALAAGHLALANVAVLSVVGTFLVFANVIITGEEGQARVQDIRAWTQPLPVSHQQLRVLLLVVGVLRGSLFTVTLVGTAATGAFLARDSWFNQAEIVISALVLPLLPVAAGLWVGARRSGPVSPGFVTVPLGVATIATAVPLPDPHGALAVVARVLAAPGVTLLGGTDPATAVAVLLVWTATAGWFLTRLDRAVHTTTVGARLPLAGRLGTGPVGRRVGADLVLHRLRPRDVAEVVLLAAALGAVAALALAAADDGPLPATVLTVTGLALPASTLGYRQVRAGTVLDVPTLEWISTLPLPPGTLAWRRHLVATAGAAVAVAVFLAVLLAITAVGLPGPCLAMIVLSPLVLTGWFALSANARGGRRILAYLALSALTGLRLITAAVLVVIGCPPSVAVTLLALDLGIALAGHLLVRHQTRSFR